jgi:hypothetical protein
VNFCWLSLGLARASTWVYSSKQLSIFAYKVLLATWIVPLLAPLNLDSGLSGGMTVLNQWHT